MTASELEGLLRAHSFLKVELPPELWEPDAELEPFIRALGEMIAAGLVRNGQELGEITLNVSNVVVEESAAGPMPWASSSQSRSGAAETGARRRPGIQLLRATARS